MKSNSVKVLQLKAQFFMDIGLVERSVLKILANHELFLNLFAFQFVLIFKDACQNFNACLNLLRVDASKAQNQTL